MALNAKLNYRLKRKWFSGTAKQVNIRGDISIVLLIVLLVDIGKSNIVTEQCSIANAVFVDNHHQKS